VATTPEMALSTTTEEPTAFTVLAVVAFKVIVLDPESVTVPGAMAVAFSVDCEVPCATSA
jgi:hypothetical protein